MTKFLLILTFITTTPKGLHVSTDVHPVELEKESNLFETKAACDFVGNITTEFLNTYIYYVNYGYACVKYKVR